MKSSAIFNKFKKDKYALLRFYLLDMMFMLSALVICLQLGFTGLRFQGPSFSLMIPGVLLGLMLASLLHNSAHNNIKNKYLNRLVGEFCGWWVLYGYQNFVLIHLLHHKYSDEDFDPVNPKGMNFLVFLSAPMRYMIKATKKYLHSVHGHHANYEAIMNHQTLVFHLNLGLRLSLWYVILGPQLFLFFYLPGILATVSIFAHINYNCHQADAETGEIEIVNLDHNLYYKLANFLTSGGYYHKNHHLSPGLFDPRELGKQKKAKELKPASSGWLDGIYL